MKIIRPLTITNAMLTASNVSEDDHQVWLVGTSFTEEDRCIVIGTTHKIYEALENVTGGDSPEIDVTNAVPKWLEISATNRWKSFDTKMGSQTSQATSITFEITPGVIIDSFAFLNMDCETIQVVSTDPEEGEVYNKTIDMVSTAITGVSGIYDWYTYFFSTYLKTTDIVRFDLPPYLNTVLSITIAYTGSTAKCGGIVIGTVATLGTTQYSPSVGIHDYSVKQADAFGVLSITERAFSKKLTCEILVESFSISNVQSVLALYRSTAIVWVASEDIPALIIYGFYKDFSILISYPTFAICSLDIEGLT